mmetsp:Transcript_36990/g.110777  ORF Transcript_36990/g.110777 Transcript_36990/m.110777 type:complete len:200 (-) Transcript_36990:218-817(-)
MLATSPNIPIIARQHAPCVYQHPFLSPFSGPAMLHPSLLPSSRGTGSIPAAPCLRIPSIDNVVDELWRFLVLVIFVRLIFLVQLREFNESFYEVIKRCRRERLISIAVVHHSPSGPEILRIRGIYAHKQVVVFRHDCEALPALLGAIGGLVLLSPFRHHFGVPHDLLLVVEGAARVLASEHIHAEDTTMVLADVPLSRV